MTDASSHAESERHGAVIAAADATSDSRREMRRERYLTLDVARGFAVLGMIWMHLVPADGATTLLGEAVTLLTRFLEGKSAALFCVLAGIAWELQAQRVESPRYFLRRTVTLALLGLALHIVWPTEILIPLALMMAVALTVRARGRAALVALGAVMLCATPLLQAWLRPEIAADWSWGTGDTHRAELGAGWATVRFLLIDGNYPVIPWLLFAIAGMRLFANGLPARTRMRRWFMVSLFVLVDLQCWSWWTRTHPSALGAARFFLTDTWIPTTLPFVVLSGAAAFVLLTGLLSLNPMWIRQRIAPVGALGRASLTHYVAHILIVYLPLRAVWPDEIWPVRYGVAALLAYVIAALPLSVLWFSRFQHGPLESVWAVASGLARATNDGKST